MPLLEEALQEARQADALLARAELLGPFTVKEVISVGGLPCTNGSRLLADGVATAGAEWSGGCAPRAPIPLGKTNLSQFSAFWDSVNLLSGATRNPHDPGPARQVDRQAAGSLRSPRRFPLEIGSDSADSCGRPPCGAWWVAAEPRCGPQPAAPALAVQRGEERTLVALTLTRPA